MKILIYVLLILAALGLLTFFCFCIVFYSPKRKPGAGEDYSLPKGKVYEPYWDLMLEGMEQNAKTPHEDVYKTSFDGLRLHGKYYESCPGAPIELMMHGYRGTAQRDFSVGLVRCNQVGHNALVIEQRASGKSGGNVISFGINERWDCLSWVDYILDRFGPDCRIILTGISMGAATVMIAAGKDLPDNVIGVLADCGYSSAEAIIKKTIREMKLPPTLLYPFVKLGAKIFGHFDLDETSPLEAMKNCKLPIIFIHGEDDDFVPCDMSREVYEACRSPKLLLTVPGAGHGLGYIMDLEGYLKAVAEFSTKYMTPTKVVNRQIPKEY